MKHLVIFFVVAVSLSCTSSNSAYKVSKPDQIVQDQPLDENEQLLLSRGIDEHDAGNYTAAKSYYEQVLEEKPYSSVAIHEMALTLNEEGKYKESIVLAKRGQSIESELRPYFYHSQGVSLDYLGETKEAIKAFEEGISINDQIHYLHYSMAISLVKLGENEQAISSLENALKVNFDHSSSHFMMAEIYFSRGSNVEALLAYTYFLMYEPNSQRSEVAFERINQVFNTAEPGEESNEVNINILGFGGGEFSSLELMLGLNSATRFTEEKMEMSDIEFIAEGYDLVLSIISEEKDNSSESFISEFYIPFLEAAYEDAYLEVLVYLIFEASSFDGVSQWLDSNPVLRENFYNWEPFPEENSQ